MSETYARSAGGDAIVDRGFHIDAERAFDQAARNARASAKEDRRMQGGPRPLVTALGTAAVSAASTVVGVSLAGGTVGSAIGPSLARLFNPAVGLIANADAIAAGAVIVFGLILSLMWFVRK